MIWRLLRKAARLLKLTPTGETVDFSMVLDEMWAVSQQEMDFLHEAENAGGIRRLNEDHLCRLPENIPRRLHPAGAGHGGH